MCETVDSLLWAIYGVPLVVNIVIDDLHSGLRDTLTESAYRWRCVIVPVRA